jgi:hypothetical protein
MVDDSGMERQYGRVDVLGGLLVTRALLVAVYDVVEVDSSGWGSASTLITDLVVVLLVAAFLGWQAFISHPLLPLRLLTLRRLSIGSLVRVLLSAGALGQFFIETLYLQHVLGYSVIATGLAFLPLNGIIGIFTLWVTTRLCDRFGQLKTMIGALVCVVAGLLLYAIQPADGTYLRDVLPPMIFIGIGCGAAYIPLVKVALDDISSSDYGTPRGSSAPPSRRALRSASRC